MEDTSTHKRPRWSVDDSACEDDDDDDDDDNDESDDRLELELFETTDWRYEAVVRESGELMTSVDKSTLAMGLDAPFRPADEVSLHCTL